MSSQQLENLVSRILLKNGRIIDGSGKASFDGHLLIEDDFIKYILDSSNQLPPADTIIDTTGLVISPGFIDMHSHADWLLAAREHEELIRPLLEQGITTVVGGNCGFSPAPVTEDSALSSLPKDDGNIFYKRLLLIFLTRFICRAAIIALYFPSIGV